MITTLQYPCIRLVSVGGNGRCNPMRNLAFAGLLLIMALTLCAPLSAQAQNGARASFSLVPVTSDPARPATQSYFIYDAAPGRTITDEVRITNDGTAAGTVRLYPVDATTGPTSGPVYLSAEDPRKDVGAWIELEIAELALGPGESRTVRFTTTIPRDARVGQHLGALVAENTATQQGAAGATLQGSLQERSATAVQVNLPGPAVEKLVVTGVTTALQQVQMLSIGLRNEGTAMVQPEGTITVLDAQGAQIQRIPLSLASILPETEIQYPVPVERQALSAGTYRARVELRYGEQAAVSHETAFDITDAQVAEVYQAAGQQLPAVVTGAPAPRFPILNTAIVLGIVAVAGVAFTVLVREYRAA